MSRVSDAVGKGRSAASVATYSMLMRQAGVSPMVWLLCAPVMMGACGESPKLTDTSLPVTASTASTSAAPLLSASSSAAPTVAPSTASAPLPSSPCPTLLGAVTFAQCRTPNQPDYPECWNYWLQPHTSEDGGTDECLPTSADLFVTGWQAISDQAHVRIQYVGSPPTRAELIRDRPDLSPLKDDAMTSSPTLEAIRFANGRAAELEFGPGMKSHVGTATAPLAPSDVP